MKKVACVNIKGGTGKTTVLYQMSCVLSERGKKVLLVDCDPQHNLTKSFVKKSPTNGVYELLTGDVKLEDVILQPFANREELSNIYLIPCNYNLFLYEKDSTKTNQIFDLSKQIGRLKNFDYILFDTNPSLSFILTSVLTATEDIVSVFDASADSLDGFLFLERQLIKDIQSTVNKDLKVKGIIFNNHDRRTNFSSNMISAVKQVYGDLVFDTIITPSYRNKESRIECDPMITFDRRHQSTLQWIDLASEFEKRMVD